ncbi:MAG: hypothetical protein NT015_11845 [Alphaproteobacteria bacterium]|nr:hypothetical protein [Alphaproteobacteria bacterium]
MTEIGPRLHTAFRKARVALWRFKRSPGQQDRAAMVATFAFIGLFAIGSVDAIITGGADFAPGSAYASEYRPTRVAPVAQPVADTLAVEEEVASTETLKSAGEVDYSFTSEELLGGPEPAALAAVEEPAAVAEFSFEDLKSGHSDPAAAAETDDTIL